MTCFLTLFFLTLFSWASCSKRSFQHVEQSDTSLMIRSFYAGINYDVANIPSFMEVIRAELVPPESLLDELAQLKGKNEDPNDIEIAGVPFLSVFALWKCEHLSRNFEYSMILEKVLNASFMGIPDIYQIIHGLGHSRISAALLKTIKDPAIKRINGTMIRLIENGCSAKAYHILLSMIPTSPCITIETFLKLANIDAVLQPETVALVFARLDFVMTTNRMNDVVHSKGHLNFISKAMSLVRPDKFTLYSAVLQSRPVELILDILEDVDQVTSYIIMAGMMKQYDESVVRSLVQKYPRPFSEAMIQYALAKGYSVEFLDSLALQPID